jgi:hypothetical protein
MLVSYLNPGALSPQEIERLKVAMRAGLACTDEASTHQHVFFEGRYFRLDDVNSVIYPKFFLVKEGGMSSLNAI